MQTAEGPTAQWLQFLWMRTMKRAGTWMDQIWKAPGKVGGRERRTLTKFRQMDSEKVMCLKKTYQTLAITVVSFNIV